MPLFIVPKRLPIILLPHESRILTQVGSVILDLSNRSIICRDILVLTSVYINHSFCPSTHFPSILTEKNVLFIIKMIHFKHDDSVLVMFHFSSAHFL